MHLKVLFVARCQGFIFEWVGRDTAIAQIVLNRCLVRRFITVDGVTAPNAFFSFSSRPSISIPIFCTTLRCALSHTQRGVDKCVTFLTEEDHQAYLRLLRDNLSDTKVPLNQNGLRLTM